MIIFGTRGLNLKDGKPGQFHCPSCNGQRPYQGRKVQRFFTLYFIPLIPLDVIQRSVQCQTCMKSFVPEVLTHNPQADMAAQTVELHENLRNVLSHFARMSGLRDSASLDRFVQIFAAFEGAVITPDRIRDDLNAPERADVGVEAARIRPMLNDVGREMVARMATQAATVDGALTDAKREALTAFAVALGMTETHLRGVLAEVVPA